MNSFTITAVGNLAKDPELAVKGDTTYARICLVGNDYAGKDEHGNAREAVTSLWFVAFESLGEAIARNARVGDQPPYAPTRSGARAPQPSDNHPRHPSTIRLFPPAPAVRPSYARHTPNTATVMSGDRFRTTAL